ncbi:conserved hypothetical protein [Trichinella spiralis]|uniref:hypothetical protein n=1 Tax=Trichinella spiralis TaxID=6334 RepID=UPI0001EFB769|nr:conserved hypothetical protein [Trichinella spiralis]
MLFIQKTVENLHGPLIFCIEGCMQDVRFWSLILSAFVQTICSVCRKQAKTDYRNLVDRSRIDSIRLIHVHCRISVHVKLTSTVNVRCVLRRNWAAHLFSTPFSSRSY